MPRRRIFGASGRRRWRSGVSVSWRRRPAPGPECPPRPGPISIRPPGFQDRPRRPTRLLKGYSQQADTRLVAVGVTEAPLEIRLLARDHAVAKGDGEG